MQRLNFHLPAFTRVIFVNEKAHKTWGARVLEIQRIRKLLDWKSVESGLREAAVMEMMEDELVATRDQWQAAGLHFHPIPEAGRPGGYKVAICKKESELVFLRKALLQKDSLTIGKMTGVPPCCLDFYQEEVAFHGFHDPTWGYVMAGKLDWDKGNLLHPFLDRIDVRLLPHHVCGPNCSHSPQIAQSYLELGRKTGNWTAMDWLSELLSLNAEWSASHGIAEIKTPVFKISCDTDASADKHVLRIQGKESTLFSERGLNFPFRKFRSSDRLQAQMSYPIR